MTYRICSFYEQAECIAPKVIGFDYDRCKKCLPECNSTRHIADAFQNGIYRTTDGNQDKSAIKTATMVLYMTEVDEVVYTGESYHMTHIIFTCIDSETPEYGSENFMSDVGGTAGLILGMSFATIVGLIDIFIQYAIRMIWLPFEKAKEFIKSLDWDFIF